MYELLLGKVRTQLLQCMSKHGYGFPTGDHQAGLFQGLDLYLTRSTNVPLTPSAFQQLCASQLCFTHRSDEDVVMRLQEKVFFERIATMASFECQLLHPSEIPRLLALVPHFQVLGHFAMTTSSISESQGETLCEHLERLPSLQKLILFFSSLSSPAMAQTLQIKTLQTLKIQGCHFGDIAAKHMAEILKDGNSSLQNLSLMWNDVGDAGAMVFAEVLPKTALLTLDLANNKIRNAGACALAASLAFTGLETLDLRFNPICLRGAQALFRAQETRRGYLTIELEHLQFVEWPCSSDCYISGSSILCVLCCCIQFSNPRSFAALGQWLHDYFAMSGDFCRGPPLRASHPWHSFGLASKKKHHVSPIASDLCIEGNSL